jgi:hypothetical protein
MLHVTKKFTQFIKLMLENLYARQASNAPTIIEYLNY